MVLYSLVMKCLKNPGISLILSPNPRGYCKCNAGLDNSHEIETVMLCRETPELGLGEVRCFSLAVLVGECGDSNC